MFMRSMENYESIVYKLVKVNRYIHNERLAFHVQKNKTRNFRLFL